MGPRWKGKNSEATALANPMSKITARLQSSLIQSEAQGLLSGSVVLLTVEPEQIDLLNRACFGRLIITTDKDKQWFQINLEEAFFLCHSLKCLKIVDENKCLKEASELWECMKSKKKAFPESYIAYSHLKKKNWVVRPGSQYGVDFVAYRHHPSLVHSEYAVVIRTECNGGKDKNFRLRVWSDFQCTVRLCGSVAKTLLVLSIRTNGCDVVSFSHMDCYSVEERTITRWNPEQCREDLTLVKS